MPTCSAAVGALLIWLLCTTALLPAAVAAAQPAQNGISQPQPGDVLSGQVTVQGTATDTNYLRYELAFLAEANSEAGWVVFAEGDQPVVNGVLAVWDTTIGREINAPIFPDGPYQLRLRVVRTDYNYDEYYVTNLTVANGEPVPTETPAGTTTAEATAAPPPPAEAGTAVFQQLTPLPSLTPFPTLTPQPTPVGNIIGAAAPDGGGGEGGVLGQLAAIETGRFARAFWRGVTITGYIFALMLLYLILRGIGRRAWRFFWTRFPR